MYVNVKIDLFFPALMFRPRKEAATVKKMDEGRWKS